MAKKSKPEKTAQKKSGSKVWSVFALASTIGASMVARKALGATWKASTGKTPPSNPEHPDTSMAEAIAWAILSGVSVGLARMLATRKAADYYRRSTGRLPGNLEDVEV
ncbi:MAG: DUF4235 domain-containing protein [Nocardioidaceae bacterium]